MGEITMTKEGVGVVKKSGKYEAIIVRDSVSGHQVFYKCTAMGLEDIMEVIEDAGGKPVQNSGKNSAFGSNKVTIPTDRV